MAYFSPDLRTWGLGISTLYKGLVLCFYTECNIQVPLSRVRQKRYVDFLARTYPVCPRCLTRVEEARTGCVNACDCQMPVIVELRRGYGPYEVVRKKIQCILLLLHQARHSSFSCPQVTHATIGGALCKKASCEPKLLAMGRGARMGYANACDRQAMPRKCAIRGGLTLAKMMHP